MYAVGRAFAAFNKWIHEDWGFSYKNRIFAAGYVTLADVDWALDQLDWMIERDVRAVNMRPTRRCRMVKVDPVSSAIRPMTRSGRR